MSYIGKTPTPVPLTSSDITDGIISTDKLAADAVVTSKITDGTIATADVADSAITNAKVASTIITGQTALTSVANDDLVLLSDTSGSAALKKMTVANLVANAGGGKILQVVSVTNQQATSTSSATFGDVTGVTAAITPSATSSKVLVMMNSIFRVVNAGTYGYFTMLRGSTNLSGDAGFLTARDGSSSGTNTYGQIAMTHIDSPNTTSETTYKMQSRSTSGEVIVNASSTDARSTVILMEIDGS